MKLRHLIGTAVALLLVGCCGSAPAEPADGSAARVDRFDAERAWRLVEHLEEIGQSGWKLAVGGQRDLVDLGLRACDCVVVEACES
jgi:hypothetical protein